MKRNKVFISVFFLSAIVVFGCSIAPDEKVTAREKIQSLSLGKEYLMNARKFQLADKHKHTLKTLDEGKKFLEKRLLAELKKRHPYAHLVGKNEYTIKGINQAKAYLRALGHDPGEDHKKQKTVMERLKISKFYFNFVSRGKRSSVEIMPPFRLKNSQQTYFDDLYYLDAIIYYIKEHQNEEIFLPHRILFKIRDEQKVKKH